MRERPRSGSRRSGAVLCAVGWSVSAPCSRHGHSPRGRVRGQARSGFRTYW